MRSLAAYDWKNPRACEGMDTSIFYPPEKKDGRIYRGTTKVLAPAMRVCAKCPARLECLEFAFNHGEHGVWGGTTYEQRRAALRRTANRRMCVVCDSRNIQVSGENGVCLSCGMSWRTRIRMSECEDVS